MKESTALLSKDNKKRYDLNNSGRANRILNRSQLLRAARSTKSSGALSDRWLAPLPTRLRATPLRSVGQDPKSCSRSHSKSGAVGVSCACVEDESLNHILEKCPSLPRKAPLPRPDPLVLRPFSAPADPLFFGAAQPRVAMPF